ncbi:hypothetical protein KAT36_00895 [Candidatus Pacearchaeota archaeon]|nr:hypothetical protein [Candidatus Pacearchaeota archaeon]
MIKFRDDSPNARAKELEGKVESLLADNKWKEGQRIMKVAIKTAERGDSLVYVRELKDKYDSIKSSKNPYTGGFRDIRYLLFGVFVVGLLFLFNSITGNVVGGLGRDSVGLVGFILMGLCVGGYFLVKKGNGF